MLEYFSWPADEFYLGGGFELFLPIFKCGYVIVCTFVYEKNIYEKIIQMITIFIYTDKFPSSHKMHLIRELLHFLN